MSRRPLQVALLVSTLALVPVRARADSAHPDPYEFQIYKLGNPQPGGTNYSASANDAFRSFARQMGAAMTSVNLAPTETLGHSGFSVTAELAFVNFGGAKLPTVGEFQGPLMLPGVHFRKGLPSSFELGGRVSWIEKSRMGIGSLELKWALNEGFTYLPDIAVRGNVSKLINSRDFDVTAGGLDIGIGKQFAIGGMITLTPYAGWNLVFVGASTGNVDFNPTRSLADSDAPRAQYTDFFVFDSVQAAANTHNRFYAGLRFIGGVFQLGGEVSYSVIGRFASKDPAQPAVDVPAVFAYSFTLGLDF
jgi:hypothetical protein